MFGESKRFVHESKSMSKGEKLRGRIHITGKMSLDRRMWLCEKSDYI